MIARTLVVVVGCLASLGTVVAAQDTTSLRRPTKDRVLAEAATTLPPGSYYLIHERGYPFTVVGAHADRDSAQAALQAKTGAAAPRYDISGPVRGTGARTPWQIIAVTVRVRGADGREQTVEYDARGVDAIFLSMPAVDKFVMPYYTQLYGRQWADSLRSVVIGEPIPRPPCHRYSFMCWPMPPVR